MVPELDGIGDGNGLGFFVEDSVAAVVVKCRSNIEPLMAAIIPRATGHGFVVDEYATSRWSKWCGIKVERSKQVFPCRDCRVTLAGAEKV